MGKKEKAAKQAAFAMQQELDSEMTEEERAAKEKSGMGLYGGLNKGEDELFGAATNTAARLRPTSRAAAPPSRAALGLRPAGGSGGLADAP